MKVKALLVFFLSLLTVLPVFSQQQQSSEAKKIAEFENTNCDDYRARLDLLLTAIENSPGANGYVIVYEGDLKRFGYGRNGKYKGIRYVKSEVNAAQALIGYFKNHLRLRRFPAERIVFVKGGFREKFTIAFWLVPDKAAPPNPTPTLKKIKQSKAKIYPNGFCGEL